MIHLGATTADSPSQVIEKAFHFFGPDGVGLHIAYKDEETIYLEGGGGHVQVTARLKNGTTESKRTEVDIQSREWQRQAQEFLGRL